jgi:hypothetical protein
VIAPSQGSVTTTSLASSTGSGAVVLATSPTITTPTINQLTSAASTALTLQSAGTTAVTINTSQYVGIGTTSPASGLDIRPGITGNFNAITMGYGRSASPTDAVHKISWSSDSLNIEADTANTISSNIIFTNDNTERMRIDSSGNLLVGSTSGTGARMDVVAADEVVSFNRSAATDGVVQRWRKAGSTVGYVSTNTYSLPSDERVKTNIVNIGYGLDFINSLRPVQYNTIFQDPENEAQKNFGLIAQEVEQALADMGKSVDDVTFLEKFVPENDRESRYGLGYQNLVPVLIKAIQELKAINDTQAETINALTARIEALENR